MTEENNGWEQHRNLVEWRLQTNEEALKRIEGTLVGIQTSLAEMKGDRKRKITALNLVVPAVVSIIILVSEAALAHFWR